MAAPSPGTVLKGEYEKQVKHCQNLLRQFPDDDLLMNATEYAKSAVRIIQSNEPSNYNLQKSLQKYTKSILDQTYKIELKIVDEDFKDKKQFISLFDQLVLPVKVCYQITDDPKNKVMELLGKDYLECLLWRAGALCYMYCHTVTDGKQDGGQWDSVARQCSLAGIGYLQLMLNVRTPLSKEEYNESDEGQVAQLLREGVFSDTHMLSLMYCGDLCYWYTKQEKVLHQASSSDINREGVQRSPIANCIEGDCMVLYQLMETLHGRDEVERWLKPSDHDIASLGILCLSRYTAIAKGPLKGLGWSYEKAEKLVLELKQLI